jgi:hypothetical protein
MANHDGRIRLGLIGCGEVADIEPMAAALEPAG